MALLLHLQYPIDIFIDILGDFDLRFCDKSVQNRDPWKDTKANVQQRLNPASPFQQ
jgi:hypothetical protein